MTTDLTTQSFAPGATVRTVDPDSPDTPAMTIIEEVDPASRGLLSNNGRLYLCSYVNSGQPHENVFWARDLVVG